jgi:hypothetical protein
VTRAWLQLAAGAAASLAFIVLGRHLSKEPS